MNIADVRTHKKLSTTTNNSKIAAAAAKHEDIVFSQTARRRNSGDFASPSFAVCASMMHFFMPPLKGHPRTSI
jgi:hypothetical protein